MIHVLAFTACLPQHVLLALGDLGSMLWHAGTDLVRGLLSGIESMFSVT
jgi:hypothetical protein